MTKCPRCSGNSKLTGEDWDYGSFYMKQYVFSGGEKKYMEYYKDGKIIYTIPKLNTKNSNG